MKLNTQGNAKSFEYDDYSSIRLYATIVGLGSYIQKEFFTHYQSEIKHINLSELSTSFQESDV